MLALVGVTLRRKGVTVIDGFSCALAPRECVAVHGRSGGGKSALLSLLLREFDPTEGAVEVDGVDMRMLPGPVLQLYRQRLGVAFAEPRLLLQRTVLENVMLPAELRGASPSAAAEQAMTALARVSLQSAARVFPESLPSGKRRLVSLARAFCGTPQILLLDEPLAGLDQSDRMLVVSACGEAKNGGSSIFVFTSNPADVSTLADRTVLLGGASRDAASTAKPAATPGATTVKITAISGA